MVEQVKMAPSGPFFSELVQGYWRLDDWNMSVQERTRFLEQHIDLGITTVDLADIYGLYHCEANFGQALALKPELRQQIQIVTKCDIIVPCDAFPTSKIKHYDTGAEHITASVERSLASLGVEQIDALLIHRPDLLLDADEVAQCFERLQQSGKVAHFGVSNFTPSQFELLQSRMPNGLITNQVEINPLNFAVADDGTLDQLQRLRVRPMAWSCLAGGHLFKATDKRTARLLTELDALVEETGAANREQVIYAWVRRFPSKPLPIIGSGNLERVKNVVDGLSLELTREQWYRVWRASTGQDVA
ncbi:aldo/keto reductase family oxidoreductase [Vibrio tritonius]|uniref:aldo/keto reductase n=1 Tax=Vibrio tritonius TaxID=1435069 RepID=UPI00315D7F7A